MTWRPRVSLTGVVVLQAFYLMVVGYIMRRGAIDWPLFGRVLLMSLGFAAVFLPFAGWLYHRSCRRRMPWSSILPFVTFLFSVPLQYYFWPHGVSESQVYQRLVLGLCLYFLMTAPILTAARNNGGRNGSQ